MDEAEKSSALMKVYSQLRNLSLIIQPGDSFFPIVDVIDKAAISINMTIFRMDDPVVRTALSNAVKRGVKVRALIELQSKGWGKRNKKLSAELAGLGIEIGYPKSSEITRLKRYHYKVMTVDDTHSLILTFNPTRKNLHYARDFGVLLRDTEVTLDLNRLFDADWTGTEYNQPSSALVVSPFDSRRKLLDLLDSAHRTIRIMDAKLEDPEALELLQRKAAEGCDIKVIGRDTLPLGVIPNMHFRRLARYKLHAKCSVIDGVRFFVGSQNLRGVSLDRRREVGIIIEDEAMARKIERVFDSDWLEAADLESVVQG